MLDPDKLNPPSRNINTLIGELSVTATANAMHTYVESDDSLLVASNFIGNAGLLVAILQPEGAEELLGTFETMNLLETPESAKVYADYRYERLSLLLNEGVAFDDPKVQTIVKTQEESPVQSAESSTRIWRTLAEHGDITSFSKWLHQSVDQLYTEFEALPVPLATYPRFSELGTLYELLYEEVAKNQDTNGGFAGSYMDAIMEEFKARPHKELLALELPRAFGFMSNCSGNTPQLEEKATSLRRTMLEQGIESSDDRSDIRITDSYLHRRVLLAFVALGKKSEAEKEYVTMQFDDWKSKGMFDETDVQKIETWLNPPVSTARTSKRKRAR